MWRIIVLATLTACAACGPVAQPESIQTVAAYEVPLPTDQDRNGFLFLLRKEAEAEGHHVDAASADELARTAKVIPSAAMTMNAAVWRGASDDESLAVIMDGADHLGQVWIMFSKGENPTLSRQFRERVMKRIMERWPGTLSLPIMPNGSIPLHEHLRKTPGGYEVNPAAASAYEQRS